METVQHQVVTAQAGRFFGWPANNGLWSWDGGAEILAGCVSGALDRTAGFHAIREPYTQHLLRSLDGGNTWSRETPENYVDSRLDCAPLSQPLDFLHPGFALRAAGDGYHGSDDPGGAFYYSYDRGRTWHGPHRFAGLTETAEFSALRLTPRTDYIVEDGQTCLLMLSARPDDSFTDRVFCAKTRDGGLTFQPLGWVVAPSDPCRAVMPATVRCGPASLVSAVRRRAVPEDRCWIDAYASEDGGQNWACLGKVGDTGSANGNPPALLRMPDGLLCCVYGRRDLRQMVARTSASMGRTWSEEVVLRDDFHGQRPDFGYPRLLLRPDGRLMALYYWATSQQPEQHIAATVWQPPALNSLD
jgi:hypothetical protein